MAPPTSSKAEAKPPALVFMPTMNQRDEGRTRGHSRLVRSASMRNALARKKQSIASRVPSPLSQNAPPSSSEADTAAPSLSGPSPPSTPISSRRAHERSDFDAFDVEPLGSDAESQRLLRRYLADWYDFSQYESLDTCFLHNFSQPPPNRQPSSIFRSSAGVYVMLAYMASTQAGKWAGADEHYGTYMASALRETKRMIAEPNLDGETISHLLHIVLGLMIISRRAGDFEAAQTHRKGAWALLDAARRLQDGHESIKQKPGKHQPVDCMFVHEWHEPRAPTVRLASLLGDPEVKENLKPGNGLVELRAARLLSCNTIRKCRWLTRNIDASDLVPAGEFDMLFQGMSTEEERKRPYELTVYATLRIISHSMIFRQSCPSCPTLTNLLRLAECAIRRFDVNNVLEQHPSFAMWWTLVMGAVAVTTSSDVESGTSIHPLLMSWREMTRKRLMWSFDDAVSSCRRSFFWFPRATPNARRFWASGTSEVDSFELCKCQCTDLTPVYPPDGADAGVIDVLLAHSVHMEVTERKS